MTTMTTTTLPTLVPTTLPAEVDKTLADELLESAADDILLAVARTAKPTVVPNVSGRSTGGSHRNTPLVSRGWSMGGRVD